ncbi:hypothetical protein L7F22_061647 [Adiantum nelumboides]|nr:hypothetical protein [Adiantum nelumboides]
MAGTKEKLHMGHHKKEDPVAHPPPAATGLNEPGAPAGQHKEGTMDKLKNKVKGGKKGEDGGSTSSSESDGEGGRRV